MTHLLIRRSRLVLCLLVAGTAAAAGPGDDPALPRAIDTGMPPVAAGAMVRTVRPGGSLQGALDSAKPGDVIELAAGATYVGNFVLRNKGDTGNRWIIIRPALPAGSLPPEGTRMTPAVAAQLKLPRILSPSNMGAFSTEAGTHHYRLIGLEVGIASAAVRNTGLIRLGGDETSLAMVPHDLVLDRMYVHGEPTAEVRRCIALNSASSAVLDSWVSDCHDSGQDSQAIAGWAGPGPFKIVNNHLEGAGENVMFGGGDPRIRDVVPSDIEFRHNHLIKPAAWRGRWLIKNLFELKNARRVLVEGNVFENSWQQAQDGSAVNMKSVNQEGTAPWSTTQDVTFQRNLLRNVGGGFIISGAPDNNNPAIHARRITIRDNVVSRINQPPFDGSGRGFLVNGDPADLRIEHNTVISPTLVAMAFGPPGFTTQRLVLRDNIIGGGQYGFKGDNAGSGKPTLDRYAPDGIMTGNVIILDATVVHPAGNTVVQSVARVGFVNAAAEDYRLAPGSPFRRRASDGRDPGADIDALEAAIRGVVLP